MKRFFSIGLILLLFLTACGKEDNTSGASQESQTTGIAQTSTSDDTILNDYIKEETEGTVEIVYRNKEPKYTHELDGFKISVDEYEIAKVTGMNENSKILFDDQTNGYIVTSKVTIENGTDKQLYYQNYHRIQLTDNELDFVQSDWKNFIAENMRINTIKQNKDDFTLFEPKEKVTGFITFALTDYEFEKLKGSNPKYIIEGGLADNSNQENSNLEKSPAYDFFISAPAEPAQPETPGVPSIFHQDKLLTENWASKQMIFEKAGINDTKQIGDVKITLDSVQYTEVIPTPGNESMFSAFGSGVAALTVNLKIDNQSGAPVSFASLGSSLDVDETRATYFTQKLVEPDTQGEIAPGEQGEKLHVFLFKKHEFDLYKTFTLNFGPINGERAVFELPR